MKKIILFIAFIGSLAPALSAQKVAQTPIYSVVDLKTGQYLEQNNSEKQHSIASLTKLMTAYVLVKTHPDIDKCFAQITEADKDYLKNTHTRMPKNEFMSCRKLMQVMLVMSDNWAASALAKTVPGVSYSQFIGLMNQQAGQWGMSHTIFRDSSGLSPQNISTAQDLNSLVWNVAQVREITKSSTQKEVVMVGDMGEFNFYKNTNKLIREQNYSATLSKTGYIKESGYNLVFVPESCQKRKIAIVIMGSKSSAARADFAQSLLDKYRCD